MLLIQCPSENEVKILCSVYNVLSDKLLADIEVLLVIVKGEGAREIFWQKWKKKSG